MRMLVIAPHPDDEVLGCGGIISKNVNKGNEVYVCIVTRGVEPLYSEESNEIDKYESKEANKILGTKEIIYLDFPAAMLETVKRHEFNEAFIKLVQDIKPDEVYLPHRGDMQLDHKMVVDACMVALRPKYEYKVKRIYSYETVSETGWDIPNEENAFIPNVYDDITETIDIKLEALSKYKSQICEYPNARSIEAITSLAIYRGTTVGYNYAECFHLIREIK